MDERYSGEAARASSWEETLEVIANAELEGEAVRVTDAARLRRLADTWKTKWEGGWQFEVVDGGFRNQAGGLGVVFAVRPVKVFAHPKGDPFGATTHRF